MNRIPWWSTHIGSEEKDAVAEAMDARRFSQGEITETFERELAAALGVRHAVVTTSGTAALSMAFLAAGVRAGDEVVVPDLGWIATANAAASIGARVVLVDVRPDIPLLDVSLLEKKVTRRTKAVVPVHLNGKPCDLEAVRRVADRVGAAVVEDACKALLCPTPKGFLGTIGDMGCYSLGMISLVSVGYGGAVVTNDDAKADRLRLIRNQGAPRTGDEAYLTLGANFKSSDLLAAIGRVQLRRKEEKLRRIHEIYRRYADGLAGLGDLGLIPVDVASGKVPLCVEYVSPRREEILSYLDKRGIEGLRFHLPLHEARYLENDDAFPNADRFGREGFILPCGPSQPLENVDRTIDALREWAKHA